MRPIVAHTHACAPVAAPPNATELKMPCWQSAGGQRSFDLDAFVQFVQGREPWKVRACAPLAAVQAAGCRHRPATP